MDESLINVLLVEDNREDADRVRTALDTATALDFALEEVPRLDAALSRLARGGIDVVLLDLALPDSQGLTTLTRTRAAAPDVPVVVLTGLDDETMAVQTVHLGAQDYLIKGEIHASLLVRALRHAIERRWAEAERARSLEAERAARANAEASGRWYRALVDGLDAVVYEADAAGRFTYVSERATTLLGLPPASWLVDPERFAGMVHPDDRAATVGTRAQALSAGRGWDLTYRVPVGDSAVLWLRDLARAVPGSDRLRYRGVLVDETAQRRTGDALRESEARYRTLMEDASDAIFVAGDGGLLTDVNERACALSGYAREDLVGRPAQTLLGSEGAGWMPAHTPSPERGEVTSLDGLLRRKEGASVQVEATVRALADGRSMSIVRDVTRRKALDEQVRQSQKMEAVGRLAGGVAHDFNNLLTAIHGYSEFLLEDLGAGDPRRGDVEEIQRAAERAAGLTRQLLAFSQRQILQPRPLDLGAVLGDMDRLLRRLIGEAITLSTTVEPSLPRVMADPGQVEQVVLNLAVNARDAMPDGGEIRLGVRAVVLDAEAARALHGAEPGHWVELAVADTGDGMDAETVAHVFEPFFTTKEVGRGSGLGLSTVYGIVRQSGGAITVQSTPGHGSTFRVYLPRHDGDSAARSQDPAPAVARSGVTVLLVEDEPGVRSMVRRALESHGYSVLEAGHGEEALRVVARHTGRIDLLLSDVVMPGMNGRELAEKLTAVRPDLRVLLMSGYTDDTALRRGIHTSRLMHKPFTPDTLAVRVREALDAPP